MIKKMEVKSWTRRSRPLTIREDGLQGIGNLFRRLFNLPLEEMITYVIISEPVTIEPGETNLRIQLPEDLMNSIYKDERDNQ